MYFTTILKCSQSKNKQKILDDATKVKHRSLTWVWLRCPNNSTPRFKPKIYESMCPCENVHTNARGSIVPNSYSMGTPHMSMEWWTDQAWQTHTYHGMSLIHKGTHTCYNMDRPWKQCTKWKKPVTCWVTPFIRNVSNRNKKEINGCLGLGWECRKGIERDYGW